MVKTFSIYRSSAGSGKTRTLAKEYLKLALQHRGYYFQHILAVTFTNKSTQEMKDRILAYLDDFANGRSNELADELKKELQQDDNTFQERSQDVQREILHHYSQFSISTIDAFFQKVIRSFTREAGLMGDYRLEVEQDLVLEEVIDDLIDELGSNKELTEWVVEFARENLENERAWDVRQNLREFAEQIFKEEFKVIEDDVINETNDHNFFQNLKSKLWQTKNLFLGKVSKPATEALLIIKNTGWDISEISYGKGSGLITFFEMFASGKQLKEYKNPSDRMRSYFSVPEKWPSKTTTRAAEIRQTAKEKLIPILNELIETYDQYYPQSLSAELALSNFYSFGLIADISRKLKEYKEQNNLMLLADAPKFLNGVIQESDTPFIYEKVGSFYRNFLIDEFQDTSGYQWKNFLPLLTNSLDQGNRSMVVGDVKQAVYRWRGGDLNLLQQEVQQQIGLNRVNMIELGTNYRSASAIVDFNNKLFKSASAVVAQKTNGQLPLEAFKDVAQKGVKKDEGFVQVQFIREEIKDEQTGKVSVWKEEALAQVSLQLEELQSKGVSLSDIAILVRKNFEGHEIATYLLNYAASEKAKPGCRYDVISNESLRLDGAASVNVLLGAMRYLQNPDDSIARAQLGYEFTRLKEPNRELTDVFTVANQVFFESNLPLAFAKSKAWLKKLPLFELTETLIEIFKIGDEKGELAYLQAFQDLVLEFYSRERNDLGAFLEWWEINKYKKSLQVSGEVDAVQIVTVHKSKGLQFKYVLIPFCSWSLDHEFSKEPLLWVKSEKNPFKESGFIPIKYSGKVEESYFSEFYREEFIRAYLDNLNLLYVACTRAEQGLFITAPHPKNRNQRESVSKLIFESIIADIELQKNWKESELQWKAGELKPVKEEKEENNSSLELNHYPASRWRDKLIIKRSPGSFFETPEEVSLEKIRYGLHMHAVLSRVHYADEILEAMKTIIAEGLITESEQEPLLKQLRILFGQPQIKDWFSNAWQVKTEVPILLPGGDESRIDRLMVKDKKAIVVDFKTGERNRQDQQQVLDYMAILRQMNFTEVEGYILYLRDMEVVNVAGAKVKALSKRKGDKDQLGLGF
ncbi:MAG TPA: UvrD-helicase domain-containing protein [Cyclobacteriaceae bacterium]|nr:UvrD-helicase domain-containing protein [Cyclobacteriaceae bacterium]